MTFAPGAHGGILDTHTARDVLYPVQLRVMRSLSGK